MAGVPRNGHPENSGLPESAVPIDAASLPSQKRFSPNSETSGSGNRTIGGSYLAAKRRAGLRESDPQLTAPTLRKNERITPRLAQPEEIDVAPSPATRRQTPLLATSYPDSPAIPSENSLQSPVVLQTDPHLPIQPTVLSPVTFGQSPPVPAPQDDHGIFPFLDNTVPPDRSQRGKITQTARAATTHPLTLDLPDVIFPPLPSSPARPLPTPNRDPINISPYQPWSLQASTLLDPASLAHLGLETIPPSPDTPTVTKILPSPLPAPARPSYLSLTDLIGPPPTPPSSIKHLVASFDISNLPTREIQRIPAPKRSPGVVRSLGPIEHPIDYSFERRTIPPKPQKTKWSESRMGTMLINGLAWAARPLGKPLDAWKLRRTVSRLHPQERAIVQDFQQYNRKPQREVGKDTTYMAPSPPSTLQYPARPFPEERPLSEKEQALIRLAGLLTSSVTLYPNSEPSNTFTAYGDNKKGTGIQVEITRDGDILCSAMVGNGNGIQVFVANPLDTSYPHAAKLVFGLKTAKQHEAFFSLNPTVGEKRLLKKIAIDLARIVNDALQKKIFPKEIRSQLNHILLAAQAYVSGKSAPGSQTAMNNVQAALGRI